eukprot:TRINITY_DN7412_c0_g1_i2.p1 TRINITY_DN7412_c0_g1~~TRINITY_DN7412_c0_g1_i2.p1  ORF type:complete len:436 (-),score=70.72 TRINITY_DN7412_c0_g1_i2:87-1394(-)
MARAHGLHAAILAEDLEQATALAEEMSLEEVNSSVVDPDTGEHETAIHLASYSGLLPFVRLLVEHHADWYRAASDGTTAVDVAGSPAVKAFLLRLCKPAQSSPQAVTTVTLQQQPSTAPRSEWLRIERSEALGEYFVAAGAIVAGAAVWQESPCLLAATGGADLARLALPASVDPNLDNTGLHAAAIHRFCELPAAQSSLLLQSLLHRFSETAHPLAVQCRKVAQLCAQGCQWAEGRAVELLEAYAAAFALNAYVLPGTSGRAVFLWGSKFNHSCVPNVRVNIDGSGTATWVALRDVSVGEHLVVSYLGHRTVWPTNLRREHLYITKAFVCQCPRCTAPHSVPDPSGEADDILAELLALRRLPTNRRFSVGIAAFITRACTRLPPDHWIVTDAKLLLVDAYCNEEAALPHHLRESVAEWLETAGICQELFNAPVL